MPDDSAASRLKNTNLSPVVHACVRLEYDDGGGRAAAQRATRIPRVRAVVVRWCACSCVLCCCIFTCAQAPELECLHTHTHTENYTHETPKRVSRGGSLMVLI